MSFRQVPKMINNYPHVEHLHVSEHSEGARKERIYMNTFL